MHSAPPPGSPRASVSRHIGEPGGNLPGPALVTGANGYVASWVVVYGGSSNAASDVRATVRRDPAPSPPRSPRRQDRTPAGDGRGASRHAVALPGGSDGARRVRPGHGGMRPRLPHRLARRRARSRGSGAPAHRARDPGHPPRAGGGQPDPVGAARRPHLQRLGHLWRHEGPRAHRGGPLRREPLERDQQRTPSAVLVRQDRGRAPGLAHRREAGPMGPGRRQSRAGARALPRPALEPGERPAHARTRQRQPAPGRGPRRIRESWTCATSPRATCARG